MQGSLGFYMNEDGQVSAKIPYINPSLPTVVIPDTTIFVSDDEASIEPCQI